MRFKKKRRSYGKRRKKNGYSKQKRRDKSVNKFANARGGIRV